MRTAIVTDSNSGIFEEEGHKLGVHIVPMPVMIDGETYYEGTNLTHEEFYRFLSEGRDVSSSQPTLGNVMEVWDSVLSSGYDEIVYIPMSSGLSGSCQTAAALAEEYGGRVHVVDNHRISVTQRHSVQDALMLAGQGYAANEIRNMPEQRWEHFSISNRFLLLKASGWMPMQKCAEQETARDVCLRK